jgi:hypothetical protein
MRYIFLLTLLSLLVHSGCRKQRHEVPNIPKVDTIYEQPFDTISLVCSDRPLPTDEVQQKTPLTNYEIARLSEGIPSKDSINHWLAFVGLPPNNPFCSAANSAWNEYAGLWHPRSGLARHWKTMQPGGMWVSAERVFGGGYVIPAGSIVVFERINTIFGHVGIVTREFTGKGSLYISANTSAPNSQGSEYSGGGVWEKEFTINLGSRFFISGFIVYT